MLLSDSIYNFPSEIRPQRQRNDSSDLRCKHVHCTVLRWFVCTRSLRGEAHILLQIRRFITHVPKARTTTICLAPSYICSTDFKLHIFDMRAPPVSPPTSTSSGRNLSDSGLTTRMPLRKVIQGHPGRWTITDANLSPDNER